MDYNAKLQNNNMALEDNNVDLQLILDTINGLPEAGVGEAISLDEEITTQEEEIAEQDDVIANIITALEDKAAGGKTTKTININWDEDYTYVSQVDYISNGKLIQVMRYDGVDIIEAEGGVVRFSSGGYYSDNFIDLINDGWTHVLVATQDGETLYAVSDEAQDV